MKKNRFIKIAAVVFTLCLITTCGISSTLAKYTTSSSASDTARVAKWGVEVSASGTMFGKAYQTTIVAEDDANATVRTVNSIHSSNLVAPGTKNDTGIVIKVIGSPEVEFKLSATIDTVASDIYLVKGDYGVMLPANGVNHATDLEAENIYILNGSNYVKATTFDAAATYYKLTDMATVSEDRYYPIKWTASVVENGSYFDANPETLKDALDLLVNGINEYVDRFSTTGTFDPNTSISLIYKLTWAWSFDGNDGADTILGNLMAEDQGILGNGVVVKLDGSNYVAIADSDYNLSVGCGFSVSATQVN